MLQPTSVSAAMPLMQAIFPSEEQKIENILQQIEAHKQPAGGGAAQRSQHHHRPGELTFNQSIMGGRRQHDQ